MMEDEGYKSQGKKASGLYHFTNLSSSILYLSLLSSILHRASAGRWALRAQKNTASDKASGAPMSATRWVTGAD